MNLANVSIRRPVFAFMLISAIMVFGLISYPKVGVDLMPDVEFPLVTVLVKYPGTDPATMEREVAEKIEESVNSLGGIRTLRSYNFESASQIVVEFELEVDEDQAIQDVRDRVARVQGDLPEGAEAPIIEKFDIGAMPILYLGLYGDLPARRLTRLADKVVKERLQRIRGVGSVEIIGGRDRQIQVYVDVDKLDGLNLTFQDVARTIAAENLEVPAGTFEAGSNELTVTTKGQLKTAQDVANIILPTTASPDLQRSGDAEPVVRISDIAKVIDGVEEARSSSSFDGRPAVSLTVQKQSGSNTVAVARAVRAEIDQIRPLLARQGVKLAIATDNSAYIARSIGDVQFDLAFGALLAVVVIFIFLLNGRATLISAIAIPTSVIATFAFVYWLGFTFNNMTMLALSIAIGVLVDDAIVVMENIHRHLEQGKGALQAAGDATNEIFLAVLSMTSSILAVFVPVAVMKGIIGRFFLQFGITVSIAVAMSMLVSFTLTPMMSSRLLSVRAPTGPLARFMDGAISGLEKAYGRVVRWALAHRFLTLGIAAGALVASFIVVSRVPVEFFPPEDRGQIKVSVELPSSTSLEATTQFVNRIADDVRKNGVGVVHTLANVGGGQQGQVNKGDIQVNMTPAHERHVSQQRLMAWFRARYAHMAPAIITVSELNNLAGPNSQPVQYVLRGDDLDQLVATADKMKEQLAKLPGFVDVDTTYRGGKQEVAIHVDRERAAALDVPVATVASAIRAYLAGDAVSQLKEGTDAYDIIVQLPKDQRQRVEHLSSLRVRSNDGTLVDLANLVHVERDLGPNKIERLNRQRQITVLANLDGLPLGTARQQVEALAQKVVPAGVTADFEGMGKIMSESFGYMLEALVLAVVLVYMILAAQFNSFIQPITIMISLPLSVIGAFGALALSSMTLNIMSMIGIIMLMGLVTKNAILLVDFANQARERGASVRDALVEAGMLRLRPILMTTIAMIFGMLPVALALGEGGSTRAPMAVCVIGGLVTSTLLTLVIIPVIYSLFDNLVSSRMFRWLASKIIAGNPSPSTALSVAERSSDS